MGLPSERKLKKGHLVAQAIASVAAVTPQGHSWCSSLSSLTTTLKSPHPQESPWQVFVDLTGDMTQTFILKSLNLSQATTESTRRHLSGSLLASICFFLIPIVKAMSLLRLNRVDYSCWIVIPPPVVLDAQNSKSHEQAAAAACSSKGSHYIFWQKRLLFGNLDG